MRCRYPAALEEVAAAAVPAVRRKALKNLEPRQHLPSAVEVNEDSNNRTLFGPHGHHGIDRSRAACRRQRSSKRDEDCDCGPEDIGHEPAGPHLD
jgi:hypothetical protein